MATIGERLTAAGLTDAQALELVRQIGTPPASAFKLFVAGFDTPVAIVLEDQIGMHHGMACSDALREQHNRAELELIGVETGQATAIAKAICGVEAE